MSVINLRNGGDMVRNIKDLRIKNGLTQVELTKIMGVTQPAIRAWESGDACPSVDKLPLLARTLRCKIEELYD